MELMSWGLLIGMIGLVWLLVASSIHHHDSQNEGRDLDRHSATEDAGTTSVEIKERQAKAAA